MVAPHKRLRVNTIFEVAAAAGLQTTYADKHPAYDMVRGPSGTGLTVGYFPEIAAEANTVKATIAYDQLHVTAWLDWIDGISPINSTKYGTSLESGKMPSIMGGNFQAVSVAQKTVGYNNDTQNSMSAGILEVMDFVDSSLGKIVAKLKSKSLLAATLIVIASKHGQAPIKRSLWNAVDPSGLTNATGVPTAFVVTDDIGLIFLNHTADTIKAVQNLKANASALHIQELIYGKDLTAQGFGDPSTDPAVPDIIVRPSLGTCYTTSVSKWAEHGGLSDDDRHVACMVSNPSLTARKVSSKVSTRQVAVTALKALGLNLSELQGAAKEGTKALPGF
ncbi:hypothetical protein MMC13_007435 [Lambiella insularis]|nr:hypothetical protein [Lambiella insularis]